MTTTTEATEHPIILNDWSIQRILAGEKTQTRRVVAPQPDDGVKSIRYDDPLWIANEMSSEWEPTLWQEECPYGHPGDVLWVREAFRLPAVYDGLSPVQYLRDVDEKNHVVQYEANEEKTGVTGEWGRKRPSIHMPRELCRIRLRVEDVRVERLTDISAADVEAEGIGLPEEARGYSYLATQHFEDVWNDIYGDGAWEKNPWVWVVCFSRIK